MINSQKTIIYNQCGKIISWALLAITSIWTLFYLSLNELIKIYLSSEYVSLFHAGLVILSTISLALAVQTSKKGRFNIRGDKDFAKKLQAYYERINEIIKENEMTLYQIRLEAEEKSLKLSHVAHFRIKTAEDLLRDLRLRSKKINQNMQNGSNAHLIAADSLIRSTSSVVNQIVNKNAFENPQQALDDTSARLRRIMKEIRIEQRKNLTS